MPPALIFDLDGTLVDTLPDIAAAMNAALETRGFPTLPRDAYRSRVGWGSRELSRLCLPEARGTDEEIRFLDREFRRRYEAAPAVRSVPFPEIPAALAELQDRGIHLSILTNKPEEAVQPLLAALFPDIRFFRTLGAADGRPRKPDPAAALGIARDLGVPPEGVYFVGDSAVDMRTARNAGMVPIGVAWGYRDVPELEAEGAARILRSPRDLLAILSEP
ncbi:MAG TPA: HAD family hydrolase [Spirochaetia bacterium]|nr:HAD family hydrolase [Spirochaetia bacterium]